MASQIPAKSKAHNLLKQIGLLIFSSKKKTLFWPKYSQNILVCWLPWTKMENMAICCISRAMKERKSKPEQEDSFDVSNSSGEDVPRSQSQAPRPSLALLPSPNTQPILARILQDPRGGLSQGHSLLV